MTSVPAVTFYQVVLWLHITAIVVGFGGTFAYGVIITTALKSHKRSVPGVFAGVTQNSRTLVTGGGVLALVTGVYLAGDRWDMSDFFVAWGIVAIIVLLGLTHTVFRRNELAALQAAEEDIAKAGDGEVQFGAEFEKANSTLAKLGGAAGLLIVLTVYVMTAKPFL
jgi:hypothetical protein